MYLKFTNNLLLSKEKPPKKTQRKSAILVIPKQQSLKTVSNRSIWWTGFTPATKIRAPYPFRNLSCFTFFFCSLRFLARRKWNPRRIYTYNSSSWATKKNNNQRSVCARNYLSFKARRRPAEEAAEGVNKFIYFHFSRKIFVSEMTMMMVARFVIYSAVPGLVAAARRGRD